MKHLLVIAFLLSMSLSFAQTVIGNGPEYDPGTELENDSWFVANVINPGGYEVTILGSTDETDYDWFTFFANAGDNLTFELTGAVDATILDIDHETPILVGPGGFTASVTGWYFVYITAATPEVYEYTLWNHTSPTLPVELTSFNAVYDAVNGKVTLKWTTATETDLRGYHVYRGNMATLDQAEDMNVLIEAQGNTAGNTYLFTDSDVQSSSSYYYWIESVDMDGHTDFYGPAMVMASGTPEGGEVPDAVQTTRLIGAYPNPFNPSTTITYSLAADSDVALDIFNLRGEQVAHFSSHQSAGTHHQAWTPTCGSGNYLIRLKSGSFEQVKMATLLK